MEIIYVLILLIFLFVVCAPFGWLWYRSLSMDCPYCFGRIDKKATVCKHCGSDVFRQPRRAASPSTGKQPMRGWYTNPDDRQMQRYWDGKQWTISRPISQRGEGTGGN